MSPNPQTPPVNVERAAPDKAAVEKVRAVFNCLSKLVLGKKIYADNNPTLVKFANDFSAALQSHFEDDDELVVSVGKHDIRWQDQVVYENDKRDESIAFIMYKDGIGEIKIRNAVTPEEIAQFVDLIKDAVRSPSQDDDIVTQMWKADFKNISYRVLDEYLVGQFGEGRHGDRQFQLASCETEDHLDTPGFSDNGRVIVNGAGDIEPLDTYLNKLAGQGTERMSEEEKERHFQDMMASFFTVSSDELRAFKEKLFEKKNKDSIVSFIAEYLDFVLLADNPSAARDVMTVVERLTDYLISELRGPVLTTLLRDTREFAARPDLSKDARDFMSAFEKKLTDASLLRTVAAMVGRSDGETEEAFGYFEAVGDKAVPTLCMLLENHSEAALHKKTRDTLVKVSGAKLPEVIVQLNIDKPQIARDVIALSKAVQFREIPKVIKELIYYPDDHVRHEAIQFLAGFGTDEAFALLVKLLDDADKGVRLKALDVVSDVNAPVVKNKVVEIAFGKEFAEREFDEQIEIFKVLGRVVGEAVLPKLKETVEKKHFLGIAKRHTKENKLLAIEALEQMKKPGAKRLLGDLAGDSDDQVRSRATEALRGTDEAAPSGGGKRGSR